MMTFRSICRIINEQLTAYSVDKVIEELELHSFELGTDTLPVHYVRLNEAIEIVKADGKDEKEKTILWNIFLLKNRNRQQKIQMNY